MKNTFIWHHFHFELLNVLCTTIFHALDCGFRFSSRQSFRCFSPVIIKVTGFLSCSSAVDLKRSWTFIFPHPNRIIQQLLLHLLLLSINCENGSNISIFSEPVCYHLPHFTGVVCLSCLSNTLNCVNSRIQQTLACSCCMLNKLAKMIAHKTVRLEGQCA